MNKKIVYYISLIFLIGIAINIIFGIGAFGYGFSKLFESNEESEKAKSSLHYHNDIAPKIDSLIEVNPQLAIKTIDKLIKEYPDIYFLELQKGIAYYKIDSLKLAIKEFEKSMNKSSNEYPRALGYIGWTLFKLEQFEEAIVKFEEAAKQNPIYILDIAEVYEMKKDWNSAVKYYQIRLDQIKSENDSYYDDEINELKTKIQELKNK